MEKISKPNILLITTDQQRFDTINALGNERIFTPHLNWLCDEGITFTRAYADCPVCIPSRATIMTGLPGYKTGIVDNARHDLNLTNTIPEILTREGYQTRAQGKMHFVPFRRNYGFEHMELPMDYFREQARLGKFPKEHGVGENEMEPVISTVHENDSLTHWTVRRSIDFLETRDESRPFFLWTSFTKPHPPYDPPLNYWQLYEGMEMPEPVYGNWSKNESDIPWGFMHYVTHRLNRVNRLTPSQVKQIRRAYYACITHIDYSLGLLFSSMRELGLFKDTWIIFTTDHGDMMGDHHMGAKSLFFEASAHIPLIIRPPDGIPFNPDETGSTCNKTCTLADIYPTILNMAGVPHPENGGLDLMKAYADKNMKNRTIYSNMRNSFFGILKDSYKYLWILYGGGELLFDIQNDPYEQNNLIGVAEYDEIKNDMVSELLSFVHEHEIPVLDKGELTINHTSPLKQGFRRSPGFSSKAKPSDTLH